MKYHRALPTFLQFCLFPFSTPILKAFSGLKAYGTEHVFALDHDPRTKDKGVIFAVNHASQLDVVIVRTVLPQSWSRSPMYYVAMARKYYNTGTIMKWFYGGSLFRMWGAYPVYKGTKNYEVALSHFITLLEKDRSSITIFPEGKVTRDGKLQEGHGGVAFLSWKTGAPVIPVAINSTFNYSFVDFITARRKVAISFGRPLFFTKEKNGQDPSIDDFKQMSAEIMHEIQYLYDELGTKVHGG